MKQAAAFYEPDFEGIVSVHEAGHAVICRILNFPGGAASITRHADPLMARYAPR
jgi:hypothetical protein